MNQASHSVKPALPHAEPLFASSWLALFHAIRQQLACRQAANDGRFPAECQHALTRKH